MGLHDPDDGDPGPWRPSSTLLLEQAMAPLPADRETPDLLTPQEHELLAVLGGVWTELCSMTDHGPSRSRDLEEMAHHLHVLQRYVLSQAAARAHPELYRRLGATLSTGDAS
jgi:hypothetical protein